MERAQSDIVGATPAQTNEVGHHIHNVGSVENPIYRFLVNHDYKGNSLNSYQQKKFSTDSKKKPTSKHNTWRHKYLKNKAKSGVLVFLALGKRCRMIKLIIFATWKDLRST